MVTSFKFNERSRKVNAICCDLKRGRIWVAIADTNIVFVCGTSPCFFGSLTILDKKTDLINKVDTTTPNIFHMVVVNDTIWSGCRDGSTYRILVTTSHPRYSGF